MTIDLTEHTGSDTEALRTRVRRLAEEKSYLQLVIRLVEQLNPLPGIEDMVRSMMQNIVEIIGGTNIKLFYWIEDELHAIDFAGGTRIVSTIDDPLVARVAETREFVERAGDPADALLVDGVIPGAWTWGFPLLVGDELIGVITIENLHISGAPMRTYLPIFFRHAALILSNEIRNFSRQKAEAALRAKTEELDNYFNNALDLFCITDCEGHFIKLNPEWERTLGYEVAEMRGRRFTEFLHPDDLAPTLAELESMTDDVPVFAFENRYRHRDGSYRWIEWHGRIRGPFIYAGARDVTARKLAEESLRLSASVFTHAREGIMITDAAGTIIDVNDAFANITGYRREEVIGRNPSMLKSGRHRREFYTEMWRVLHERGHWHGEIWNRRKEGEVYAELLTISAVRGPAGAIQQYVALFSDITVQKEYQRQLEHIAHYDALTGLPNRVLLADRLQQSMAHARRRGLRLAVAYIDLDGFKGVNDRHGHDAGDQLLVQIASRMRQALREGDTVARLGGDEFVAVFVDLPDMQASVPLVLRLLAAAAQPVYLDGRTLQVSGSLGVTFYPQPEEVDGDQLLRQADQAMYQAKLAGRNRYHIFDAEHDRTVRGHHETLERVRVGLEHGEFELHYQPKVNLRTGEVVGAEALIRWQHPERGLLAPGAFLPATEDHPIGVELGEWVLNTALAQVSTWQRDGIHLPVSVNISARHLQRADFVARLRELLARHPEVDAGSLQLEVLESSALEDVDHVSEVIRACATIGVGFALDDFGTGYSSLTYLKRLPAQVLKIDQSFVRDMLEDPEDLAILEGVMSLATAFHRQVIAEGVETVAHGELLLHMGCELAQGYGIARPMPAHELPRWLGRWRPDPAWSRIGQSGADDRRALFAGVEHRAWMRALEEYLAGRSEQTPPLDPGRCDFGRWLQGAVTGERWGHGDTARRLVDLHRQVHGLANELVALRAGGQPDRALARLPELQVVSKELVSTLLGLLGDPG